MLFARFARKKRVRCGSFFGLCPKNEPLSLPFRTSEASAKRDLLFCHVLRKYCLSAKLLIAKRIEMFSYKRYAAFILILGGLQIFLKLTANLKPLKFKSNAIRPRINQVGKSRRQTRVSIIRQIEISAKSELITEG